jgi:hypothetical protein
MWGKSFPICEKLIGKKMGEGRIDLEDSQG